MNMDRQPFVIVGPCQHDDAGFRVPTDVDSMQTGVLSGWAEVRVHEAGSSGTRHCRMWFSEGMDRWGVEFAIRHVAQGMIDYMRRLPDPGADETST